MKIRPFLVGLALASSLATPAIASAAGTSYTPSGPTPAPGSGSVTLPVISVHTISPAASLSVSRIPLGRIAVAIPKGLLGMSQQLVIGNAKKLERPPAGNLTVFGAYSVGVVNSSGQNLVAFKKFITVVVRSSAFMPGNRVFLFVSGKWVPALHYSVSKGVLILHVKGSVSFEMARAK